jgi:vacuolar-type H+-ATPase subunit H
MCPAGNDPTSLAELEQSFGVTSSAEELIKSNHSSMTDEQRAGALKPPNDDLTNHVREDLSALEEHLGHEVVDATVRGSGAFALIHYAYIGARDAYEKDYVPFADVYGDDRLKQRRAQLQARAGDPDKAARSAAAEKVREADEQAAETLRKAREEADRVLADAKEQVAKIVADANAKAAEDREDLPEQAQKAADEAREQAARDKADAEAERQPRTGDGGAGVSGTASGRTGKQQKGKAGGSE